MNVNFFTKILSKFACQLFVQWDFFRNWRNTTDLHFRFCSEQPFTMNSFFKALLLGDDSSAAFEQPDGGDEGVAGEEENQQEVI